MQSKLKIIPEILLTVTENVSHYKAMNQTDKYIVWAEDSEGDSVEGDDKKINQSIQGTIDYFTKEEIYQLVSKRILTSGENARTIKNKIQAVLEQLLFETFLKD